jgi:putative FmdB family regulatory protein
MPTYDFICNDCSERFDVFLTYSEYGKRPVTCSHCGSKNVRRRMTRVRIAKSDESHFDNLDGELGSLGSLENDPRELGRMMRKLGKEMGEEVPPEFNEVVGRLEAGQSAEEIESALPDLGDAPGGNDDL